MDISNSKLVYFHHDTLLCYKKLHTNVIVRNLTSVKWVLNSYTSSMIQFFKGIWSNYVVNSSRGGGGGVAVQGTKNQEVSIGCRSIWQCLWHLYCMWHTYLLFMEVVRGYLFVLDGALFVCMYKVNIVFKYLETTQRDLQIRQG